MRTGRQRRAILAFLALLAPAHAEAEVRRVVVVSRDEVLRGVPFGEAGAYEKLSGAIHFAFDPADGANARVVDLDKAPRAASGRVEARADFVVLQPKDARKGRGVALLEVSNRGGKAALRRPVAVNDQRGLSGRAAHPR